MTLYTMVNFDYKTKVITQLLHELEMDVDPFATSYFVLQFMKGSISLPIEYSLNPLNDIFMPNQMYSSFIMKIVSGDVDSIIVRIYYPVKINEEGNYISGQYIITFGLNGEVNQQQLKLANTDQVYDHPLSNEFLHACQNVIDKINQIIGILMNDNTGGGQAANKVATNRTIHLLGKKRRLFYNKTNGYHIKYKGTTRTLKEARRLQKELQYVHNGHQH